MEMARKKRILFGAVDIGYRIDTYSKFIEEYFSDQLIAESFSKYVLPQNHFKTQYTYVCPVYHWHPIRVYLYCFCFFIYALFRFDVFHFLSGELILTRKLRRFEMQIYKLLGKKVIMHFVGADIRSVNYLDWKSQHMEDYLAGKPSPESLSLPYQKALIQDALDYADTLLVSTPDLLDIIASATYLPVFLNWEHLPERTPKAPYPPLKILFSPSGTRTKGNQYIYAALDRLKETYGNRVEIYTPGYDNKEHFQYSTTRYDLLQKMGSYHIVIDQMLIGWYGLKTLEALAMGCTVICFMDSKYQKFLFPHSPIVEADIHSLYHALEQQVSSWTPPHHTHWIQKHHHISAYSKLLQEIWIG
jgi:hypothetical protein